jgi:hypothetical protein
MRTTKTKSSQEEYNRKSNEQYEQYKRMLQALDERNKGNPMSIADYQKAKEALERYDPFYMSFFSENEPEWMKPIKAHYRHSISYRLRGPNLDQELTKMGNYVALGVWLTTVSVLNGCLFGMAKYLPKPFHYLPLIAAPIISLPFLCAMHDTYSSNKKDEAQLEHYRSISLEQLLREAHEKNLVDTRSVYTPTPYAL